MSHDSAHGSGAGHEHPEYLAHHWETPQQQFEAGKLGMWLFLATEVLLFGGLFCAYAVWRGNHPELFKYGSTFLETKWGAINTCVLILSSLTMAWGVTAAQQNKQGLLKIMLFLTLCGAAGFMVIKYIEYSHKFHEGWYPGLKFYDVPGHHSHTFQRAGGEHHDSSDHAATEGTVHEESAGAPTATLASHAVQPQPTGAPAATTPVMTAKPGLPAVEAATFGPAPIGPSGLKAKADIESEPFTMAPRHGRPTVHPLQDPHRPPNTHMFFNIYFMMTGLHGIHVLIGMIVIGWLLVRTYMGHFSDKYFTPVDLGGLYWHIVDLIWIFLFPLFYLI